MSSEQINIRLDQAGDTLARLTKIVNDRDTNNAAVARELLELGLAVYNGDALRGPFQAAVAELGATLHERLDHIDGELLEIRASQAATDFVGVQIYRVALALSVFTQTAAAGNYTWDSDDEEQQYKKQLQEEGEALFAMRQSELDRRMERERSKVRQGSPKLAVIEGGTPEESA